MKQSCEEGWAPALTGQSRGDFRDQGSMHTDHFRLVFVDADPKVEGVERRLEAQSPHFDQTNAAHSHIEAARR